MASLEPLSLRLVQREWVDSVPSPAHDALTPAERRAHLREYPHSYLGVTRAPEDTPPGETWTPNELLTAGRASLEALLLADAFNGILPPQLYAYQLSRAGWTQTGVVGGLAVRDYEAGEIRIHEQVYHHRAEHLANHAAVVRAQSSPIAVAHRPVPEISRILAALTGSEAPLIEFTMKDGLVQRVWAITDADADVIQAALAPESLYLIDGHHRAAAGLLHHRTGGDGFMLGAAFSVGQLQNRPFHRIITGVDAPTILRQLGALPGARRIQDGTRVHPSAASTIEVVSHGEWIAIPTSPHTETPLERLDTWHFEHVIRPTLGEVRVDYVAGKRPISDLMERADAVDGVLALMTAVDMADLLAIADQGQVMPPKSTYFEPKVRSGVFLREI